MKQKIEKIGGVIFLDVIVAMISKIFDLKWSASLIIFVFVTLIGVLIIWYWKEIKIYINNRFNTRIKLKKIEGFFGREEIIIDIIKWLRNSKRTSIGIIHGFGGSGKTTLAKEFERVADNYCNSLYFNDQSIFPSIHKIKNNTIIFIDYVYEYTKDENSTQTLCRLINDCSCSKKKICILFLERTNLIEYILYALDLDRPTTKRINLNDKGINNKELLQNIFAYRLSASHSRSEDYVKLIVEKFDPEYCRPMFADIMCNLLSQNPDIDFSNYE